MSDSIVYKYSTPSQVVKRNRSEEMLLAKYSEVERKTASCFFWGKLTRPYETARCLIALSETVQSSFNLSPFQMALLKDPVVTAGNGKVRFEGFSHCAGVYARVDVLPDGHEGEFPENGTTNVDFNPPMIRALSGLRRGGKAVLSVGRKEVALHQDGKKVVERKVPLPAKWIKGLTTVQLYLADTEEVFRLNRMQAMQLFRRLPKGKVKKDYYLGMRGKQPHLSVVELSGTVCIGGVHRLRLMEGLLPLVDEVRVFAHGKMQSTTWQLYFGPIRMTYSFSRDFWRGFSGEGAALESLIEDIPEAWITRFDNYSFANQEFNPTMLAVEEGIDFGRMDQLAARLSAMGLLGYDLDGNQFFYRRLPFKLRRILSLNPRMENALKLLKEGKVHVLSRTSGRVEATVEGSGIQHTVLLEEQQERCTCTWYARHQGERGICKHILAVKKKISA